MPRKGVTIIELLLSCPGDVIDLLPVTKDCVDEFNRLYGSFHNLMIELKHWKNDSFPQPGGPSQELLNHQFIHKCDICVALFGNRFGTPTEKYESGTEEEIVDMINSGKQVFLYFIERPVDPTTIDPQQLGKVLKFKEKYKDIGIYCQVKNNEEFKQLLLKHLILYMQHITSSDLSIPPLNSTYDDIKNIEISIAVPRLDFPVDYYILHVKDGKDKFLPNDKKMPINKRIKMIQSPNDPNIYSATITTHGNIGFQFKCYAKCDPKYYDELMEALRNFYGAEPYYKFSYTHPSVKKGSCDDFIWFLLPQYHMYETEDDFHPFLNNYYNI